MPMTHFEKWARSVRYLLPSFFKQEEPDMDKAAEAFLSLNGKTIDTIKDLSKEDKDAHMSAAYHIGVLYDRSIQDHEESLQRNKKARGIIEKALELYRQEVAHAQEQGKELPDGMSPKVKELYDRGHRLGNEANYISNGAYSSHEEQMAEILTFLHDFNYCGKKLFRIEEQLTHELTLTHIEGVSAGFFKLPYQTICVHSPFNDIVRIKGKAIKWSYLSEYQEEDGRHIHVMYVDDQGYPFFHEFIFDDGPLGKQVKSQIAEFYGKEAAKENMAAFSMIASMMLYLNSSERDVREMSPRVMDKRTDSRLPVCSIGGSIRVDRSLRMGSNADGTLSNNTIHILKWTVRGHFRNQACGKDLSERKIIWVRPYLKGKERGNDRMPVRNQEYVVDANLMPNEEPQK